MFRVWVILFVAVWQTGSAAFAEDITGTWAFESAVDGRTCKLSGTMEISSASENGIRSCAFKSTSVCDFNPPLTVQMEQTCRITPQGASFIIRSKVIGTLTDGYDVNDYLADHFIVKPSGSGKMEGLAQDDLSASRVVFWRNENASIS